MAQLFVRLLHACIPTCIPSTHVDVCFLPHCYFGVYVRRREGSRLGITCCVVEPSWSRCPGGKRGGTGARLRRPPVGVRFVFEPHVCRVVCRCVCLFLRVVAKGEMATRSCYCIAERVTQPRLFLESQVFCHHARVLCGWAENWTPWVLLLWQRLRVDLYFFLYILYIRPAASHCVPSPKALSIKARRCDPPCGTPAQHVAFPFFRVVSQLFWQCKHKLCIRYASVNEERRVQQFRVCEVKSGGGG